MSKEKTVLTKEERDAIIDALLEEHCDDPGAKGAAKMLLMKMTRLVRIDAIKHGLSMLELFSEENSGLASEKGLLLLLRE
jgi:hypothetical protein